MRDLILIAPPTFRLSEIVELLERDQFEMNIYQDRLSLKDKRTGEFLQFEQDNKLAAHYEDEEGDVFSSNIRTPNFFIVSFKDIALVKGVISSALNRDDVYLDNEFGLIQNGREFAAILSERPEWDWAIE
ncbi:hypothetical protein [Pseudoduganella armeniaca]|nr:hypothetical protein [Pseudoduganella armeniaca]